MSEQRKPMGLGGLAIIAVVFVLVLEGMHALVGGTAPVIGGSEEVLARIRPVGQLNTGAPAATVENEASANATAPGVAMRTGEQIFNSTCQTCHSTGAAGAPKVGDKAAWAPRIAQGMDVLLDHALKGFKAMPPRGTCSTCTDEELKSAIEFMLAKSK